MHTNSNSKILSNKQLSGDQELSLRPEYLNEFIGQSQIKDNLAVFIKAARKRHTTLDHTLFYGPPGLGKTTLAHIIAREMGVNCKSVAGPILSKAADLAAILTNLQRNDVLFIDEIHRLNANIEEILYPAMEDFVLDIIIGEGPAARSMRINLPRFTLIGATTRLGLLTNPLRDRFGIPCRLNFYQLNELQEVIIRASQLLSIDLSTNGAIEIAKRSRGTPRIALRLLRRVSDFAAVQNMVIVDSDLVDASLNRLEVDKIGLDSNDYRYLRFIADHYQNKPVGIETIAAALSEQRDVIEDTIEPYLMQIGFLQRTARGRVLTNNAFEHLGLDYRQVNELRLFGD